MHVMTVVIYLQLRSLSTCTFFIMLYGGTTVPSHGVLDHNGGQN